VAKTTSRPFMIIPILTSRMVMKAVGWLAPKLPYGEAAVTAIKALTPDPPQIRLVQYGENAADNQLDRMNAEP